MKKRTKTPFGPVAQWLLLMSVGTVVLIFLIAYRPEPKVKVAPTQPAQTTVGTQTKNAPDNQTAVVMIAFLIGLLVLRFQYKRLKVIRFREQIRNLLEHQQALAAKAKENETAGQPRLSQHSHQQKETENPSLELLD